MIRFGLKKSEEFKSEIISTDTEEEGDSSEEKGKEEDIVNANENTRNVGEMHLPVVEIPSLPLGGSRRWRQAELSEMRDHTPKPLCLQENWFSK